MLAYKTKTPAPVTGIDSARALAALPPSRWFTPLEAAAMLAALDAHESAPVTLAPVPLCMAAMFGRGAAL